MKEKLDQLIEKALEGTDYALSSENKLSSLPGSEVLPEIKKGLLKYSEDKNLTKLREVLDIYKRSNMLNTGETVHNAIWYQTVQVQGKTELFGSIFDEIEDIAWKLVKKTTGK